MSEVAFAENPLLASQIHDLEGADGVTRSSLCSYEDFLLLWEGCRDVFWNTRAGMLQASVGTRKPWAPGIRPFHVRLPSTCWRIHPSVGQPPPPQGPTWWIEHCPHTAPKYKCYGSATWKAPPLPVSRSQFLHLHLAESFWRLSHNVGDTS